MGGEVSERFSGRESIRTPETTRGMEEITEEAQSHRTYSTHEKSCAPCEPGPWTFLLKLWTFVVKD